VLLNQSIEGIRLTAAEVAEVRRRLVREQSRRRSRPSLAGRRRAKRGGLKWFLWLVGRWPPGIAGEVPIMGWNDLRGPRRLVRDLVMGCRTVPAAILLLYITG